jgi:putative DNA primase/helicase
MIFPDVKTIAALLGGEIVGQNTVNVPGPGHSPKDRSLSIKCDERAPDGFVVYSHAGQDPLLCRDYIRERLGLPHWQPNVRREPPTTAIKPADNDVQRRAQIALRIWNESTDPRGTIVERYLRDHRSLPLPSDICGTVLRFHRSLYHSESRKLLPGMVALFRNIHTNAPSAIHRTFLDPKSGLKLGRPKLLGPSKGSVIKFDPEVNQSLTIGEGIESVLSARAAGFSPAWALGSSGPVGSFPVLDNIAELTLLEENDPTSARDVDLCARRYLQTNRPVTIVNSSVGSDFNDAWKAAQ